jgi:thiol-disulfide isomerase/thioredoxin
MKRSWLVLLCVLLSGSVVMAAPQKRVSSVSQKKTYPVVTGVTAKDVFGKSFSFDAVKNKVVLVTFFATWCPPCLKEIPELVALQSSLAPQGFQVLAISVDDALPKQLAEFSSKKGLNYPVVMKTPALESAFGSVEAIPTVFIVNRNQQIVDRWAGYLGHAQLMEKLKKWL